MLAVEFEGSMLITQTWIFEVTVVAGLPLEHFATQTVQYARREDSFALGFDVSLDDDAVVMPLALVLPQLPRLCPGDRDVGGGGGRQGGPGRRDGPGGRPGDGTDDPTAQDCGSQNDGPDFRFYTNYHTSGSILDYYTSGSISWTVSMALSNPLGVGYGIKDIDLRVDKTESRWVPDNHGSGDLVPHSRVVTQFDLVDCHSITCVFVPANCSADQACGRVPFSVTGTLKAPMSEVQDTDRFDLDINSERVATSSHDYTVASSGK